MRRILERRTDRDHDPLSGGRLLIVGSDRDRCSLLDQALDDHPGHLADVGAHLLARGTPGGGPVGQQGGAIGVPHSLVGRLDGGREGVGAEFPAHGASIAPPPIPEGRKVVSRPSYAPALSANAWIPLAEVGTGEIGVDQLGATEMATGKVGTDEVGAVAWHLRVGGPWRALPAGWPPWRGGAGRAAVPGAGSVGRTRAWQPVIPAVGSLDRWLGRPSSSRGSSEPG